MAIQLMSSKVLVSVVFHIYLLFLIIPQGCSVKFNFNFSDQNILKHDYMITFQGQSSYYTDSISLTRIAENLSLENSIGRATYRDPVPLWDKDGREVTSFETQFSFLIHTVNSITNNTPAADGFAFFLSSQSYSSELPTYPNNFVDGRFLGLFNGTTGMNTGTNDIATNQIVAVEFDTFLNQNIDPNSTPERTSCHIGIDINTIVSTTYEFIGDYICLNSTMTAKIEYNSGLKVLGLLLWADANPEKKFSLNATVDITEILPSMAVVGFSAANGGASEIHRIFSWSFNSTLEKHKSKIIMLVISVIVPCTFIMFCLGILIYYIKRMRSIKNRREKNEEVELNKEFIKGSGPKKFLYNELVSATNGFGDNEKLGEGGFGSVYKGILKDENTHVAVKRVSKESQQGKKEYISEVKIISQLRHRNLVQLIGWCHDHGEFFLVYELMHNGSLDKHLCSKESVLIWPIRHNIAIGLGSALLYLHEGWEQGVVHRDIKPSNIMLDSSFTAKLGDFGLARFIDHNRDLETTILAGTRGYIAPECIFGMAKPSIQSDVYSFGIVLLEITCGRRPIMPQEDQRKVSLVEWVWNLYGQNTLLEAVDERLGCNFVKEEAERLMVVGLWCAHPEKSSRPSMKQAMNVLQFQTRLPDLPSKMPLLGYSAPLDINMQLCTSHMATSSGAATASPKSAPVASSGTSRLLKQQANTM